MKSRLTHLRWSSAPHRLCVPPEWACLLSSAGGTEAHLGSPLHTGPRVCEPESGAGAQRRCRAGGLARCRELRPRAVGPRGICQVVVAVCPFPLSLISAVMRTMLSSLVLPVVNLHPQHLEQCLVCSQMQPVFVQDVLTLDLGASGPSTEQGRAGRRGRPPPSPGSGSVHCACSSLRDTHIWFWGFGFFPLFFFIVAKYIHNINVSS